MPLHPVYGHDALRHRLAAAITAQRLPQTLLLEGPAGVGKQRLALWIAQYLVCEHPTSDAPCGACRPCSLALSLSHPDIHWFIPLELGARSGDADRQIEQAEEALAEVVAARRADPLYAPPGGMAAHPMAAIRLLLRRLSLTAALGGPRVFIVGDAERLRPQTGLEAAANALLKALEEPAPRVHFILTASDPAALLPTIRSRVVRVRVPRVPDSVVTAFVQERRSGDAGHDATVISAAGGCIGRVVAYGTSATAAEAATRFLDAARRGEIAQLTAALGQAPYEARGGFTEMLDGLLEHLRVEAKAGRNTQAVVAAISRVLEIRALARGNVNPQLLAAVLGEELGLQAGAER